MLSFIASLTAKLCILVHQFCLSLQMTVYGTLGDSYDPKK